MTQIERIRFLMERKNEESFHEYQRRKEWGKFISMNRGKSLTIIEHFHPDSNGNHTVPNGHFLQKRGWYRECVLNERAFDTAIKQTFRLNEGGDYFLSEDINPEQYGLSDYRGGIITFSTDMNSVKLDNNTFLNRLKQTYKTFCQRVNKDGKINKIINSFNKGNGEFTGSFSVGNFFRGRYYDDSGKLYNEKSLSVEINGLSSESLIKLAEMFAIEFYQETVLVKDLNYNKIYLANGNRTDSNPDLSNINRKV